MGGSFGRSAVRLAAIIALWAGWMVSSAVAETAVISAVEVQEEAGVTRVVLRGIGDAVYSASLSADESSVVVDVTDVGFSGISVPIRVDDDRVTEISVSELGPAGAAVIGTRVAIGLVGLKGYRVYGGDDGVVIEVSDSVGEATGSGDGVVGESARDGHQERAGVESDAIAASAPVRVRSVRAEGSGVEIVSDGSVDSVDSFVLENPSRLVIDLWGVKNSVWPASVDFVGGVVSRARIGEHPDKVRVVLDLRHAISRHEVASGAEGVRVDIFSEDVVADIEESSPSDPATIAAAAGALDLASGSGASADGVASIDTVESEVSGDVGAPTTALADQSPSIVDGDPVIGSAQVMSAYFESLNGVDRVVVEMDRTVDAEMIEPSSDTLIVRLPNSRIERAAERRVDTREFGGVVELFSVFQTPDVAAEEVRVVLRRSNGADAVLGWEGSRLTIGLVRPMSSAETGSESEAVATTSGENRRGEGTAPVSEGRGDKVSSVSSGSTHALASEGASTAGGDPFGEGPSDPAAIDLLNEGGFDEEKTYEGRRISLDFKDAEIANILRLIAEVSDLNVIAGEEVSGKVTIRLVEVPWDQALDVILLTKGLGFIRVGNVLRIAPIETLKLEREARLQERRAKEKLEDLSVKLQPVNYANVKEVGDLVKKLLSSRGTVNVDKRTNTLIIKDIPSVIHEATALVKAIDTQTPQVLIEAKIVEASLNFSRALGAQWGIGYRPSPGKRAGGEDFYLRDGTITDTSASTGLGSGTARTSLANNFVSSNPITGVVNGLLSMGFLGLDDQLQLDLLLAAAEENRKGKVISSPRVVTLDNREAVIKQGVAIKFTEATQDKITTSFVDAVLELKVTPHITANKSIIMDIKVSRNAPQLAANTGDVVGINKNETNTEALIRDGETMVLGGIYVVENGSTRTKVPFLADIPLIGSAFRSSTLNDERRELLIFVTPRVVLGPTPDA